MATFLSDTFTDTAATALESHVGETGATWTEHGSFTAGAQDIRTNRVRCVTATACHHASGSPASADYEVEAVFFCITLVGIPGIVGRVDTATNTMYLLLYNATAQEWRLQKVVTGTTTTLATFAQTLSTTTAYTVKLQMVGSAIKGFVDGVERLSVTDTAITAAGKAGLRAGQSVTTTAGIHTDSITATDVTGGTSHERAASLDATGAIATSGTFWTTFQRSTAVDATGAVTAVGQRALQRSAAVAATGQVTAGRQVVHIRSTALAATGAITGSGTFWSTLQGAATLNATAAVTASGQRALLRTASLDATAAISAAGEVQGQAATYERAATLEATSTVTIGVFQRVLLRQVSLQAIGSITTVPFAGRPWNYDGTPVVTYSGTPDSTYDGADDWTYSPVS